MEKKPAAVIEDQIEMLAERNAAINEKLKALEAAGLDQQTRMTWTSLMDSVQQNCAAIMGLTRTRFETKEL